jgi:hypothetical protein
MALLGCGALLAGPRIPSATAVSPACTVDYQVTAQLTTGFTAELTITNNGPEIPSWDLQYAYTGDQQLTAGSGWSQSGENVTVSSTSPLARHASTMSYATFSYSGANDAPTAFTLNGTACAVAGTGALPPGKVGVSITTPTGGFVPTGSTVMLSADASAGHSGTVTGVTFYAVNDCGSNTTADLGTATTAPYDLQWADVPLGNFSIAAVVSTSQGAGAMSQVVEMTTTTNGIPPPCPTVNGEPVIAVLPPAQGRVLNSDGTTAVTALVGYGSSGSPAPYSPASSVTFTAVGGCGATNTINLGSATTAPYTVQWVNPPIGVFTITAVADGPGYTLASAPVQVAAGPNGTPVPCPTMPPSPTPSA